MNNVVRYYEDIDEDSRFSRNSRRIEFLTTTRILDSLLPSRASLLDVGAGTGPYSFYYAERGHRVVALDLTPKHAEAIHRRSLLSGLPVEAHVGNAVDLGRWEAESFDAVLVFGPMYHLTEERDRDRCVREALRVLKPGGLVAVAYINVGETYWRKKSRCRGELISLAAA